MPVKAEIPDEQVRAKSADFRGKGGLHGFEIDGIAVLSGFEAPPIHRRVHLGPIRRHVLAPAEANMEDRRVVEINVPSAVAMVRIGVQNGNAVKPMSLPEPYDGDGDIIEAAVAPEEVAAGMMTPGTDEGERVEKLAEPDPFGRRHHPSDRVACGQSEGVSCHSLNEIGCMNLQDHVIRHRLRLEQGDLG
jgi:hypothetical protein